jgi:membrane dipeptidase
MQRLGMVIDVAHLAKPGVMDVLRMAKRPVISSHTGVQGVRKIPRNLDDQELKGIAAGGGVVGIFYLPAYVKRQPEPLESAVQGAYNNSKLRIKTKQVETADVKDVVDHMEYVAEKFGIDHVGLGSDFDGYGGVMKGIEDVTCLVNITAELLRRGYRDGEILKVLGGNFAGVLKANLP